MNKMKRIFFFSLAFLAACASAPSTPDWVSGAAAKYPATQYLVGRGQADSGDDASDRARADVAKIFGVEMTVESEDTQAFSGGAYQGHSARRVVTRTERLLEGVEIAEIWRDSATKNYHALAVLPRLKAAHSLRQEIARLDGATQAQLDNARNAQDLLLKIAAAAQAVAAQSERMGIQKTLRIVDATGQGETPTWNLDRLRADLDALLKRLKLVARVGDAELETIAKGALAAAGLLGDISDNPAYALEANLGLDDLGRQDGWYWRRGTLEIRLIELANNRVRGTQRWPIKSSALTSEAAARRALDQADAILKKELRQTLIGFAAGTERK